MVTNTFRAFVAHEEAHQRFSRAITRKPLNDLPPGDVLVRVYYSSLVFYREDAGGILVSRILHQRMLPKRHDIDDDGTGDHE